MTTALATVFQSPAGGSFGLAPWLDSIKEGTTKRVVGWFASRIADSFDELLVALRSRPDDEVIEVCEAWANPGKLILLAGVVKLLRKSMHGQLTQAIPHIGEGLPLELQVHALAHIFLVLKFWENSDLFDVRKLSDPKIAAATTCWEIASIRRSIPWQTQHVLATTVTDAWEASVIDPSTFEGAWKKAASVAALRAPANLQLVENFVEDHQLRTYLDGIADAEMDVQFDSEDVKWRLCLTFRVEDDEAAQQMDDRTRDLQLQLPEAVQDLIAIHILQRV